MKCKECMKTGKKSTVHAGESMTTLMSWESSYYNEDGKLVHRPNPNTTFTDYRCSNGHKWSESYNQAREYEKKKKLK